MSIRRRIIPAALALMCLLVTNGFAQEKAKEKAKSYTFQGKVEAVTDKGLTVNGEKVEGWMDAMTMGYKIDNEDAFKTVKAGDTIEATVYDGDYKLYKVHTVKAEKKK